MNPVEEERRTSRLLHALEGVENEDYHVGDQVVNRASSSSRCANGKESKDGKPILKKIVGQRKHTVELRNSQEFCFTSALQNYGSGKHQSAHSSDSSETETNSFKTNDNKSNYTTTNISLEIIDMTCRKGEINLNWPIKKREHTMFNSKGVRRKHPENIECSPNRPVKKSLTKREQFTENTANVCPVNKSVKMCNTSNHKDSPVKVKEKPVCDEETDNHKILSNKLHSYKQIEKGEQICEMLFSHIPVADNSATEEIYVSKVSESVAPNASSKNVQDQVLYKTAVQSRIITDGDTAHSSSQTGVSVCVMSEKEVKNVEGSSLEAKEDEKERTEQSCDSSRQSLTLKAAGNEHLHLSGSCSERTELSPLEINSSSTQHFSSRGLPPNSSSKVLSNTVDAVSVETVLSQSSDISRKANERSVIVTNTTREFGQCDNKHSLSKHLVAQGNRKFVCSVCCKGFIQQSALDEHNRFEHASEEQTGEFKCPECNKAFDNNQYFRRHQSNKHSSGRCSPDTPSTCDVCQQTFQKRTEMVAHRRFEHGSEAGFNCDKCSMVFNYEPKLLAHIKVNH